MFASRTLSSFLILKHLIILAKFIELLSAKMPLIVKRAVLALAVLPLQQQIGLFHL
jgi:hypothetical protein